MVWNSSGSDMGMGLTLQSTCLYLRMRVVGSVGRSGGYGSGGVVGSHSKSTGDDAESVAESVLTEAACLMQGCIERYTLLATLVGSLTDTSTLPVGRSLKRQRAAC